jgi:hypothetical protein
MADQPTQHEAHFSSTPSFVITAARGGQQLRSVGRQWVTSFVRWQTDPRDLRHLPPTPHVSLTWLAMRGSYVIWNNLYYAMCPRWDGWAPLRSANWAWSSPAPSGAGLPTNGGVSGSVAHKLFGVPYRFIRHEPLTSGTGCFVNDNNNANRRFSQRQCWKFMFSGTWRRVVWREIVLKHIKYCRTRL